MSNKKLIKKLKSAYVTCFDCGDKYGVYSVGYSSIWEGKCDVCGKTKNITEARDFAYFVTGIRKLTLEDKGEVSIGLN
jgi:ribosomal protein S27E